MAKKITLDSNTEPSWFTITGISCHLKDYRLSFMINQKLPSAFIKMDDLPGSYSLYFYKDEESRNSYYLISNRNDKKILFPELKQTDFLLLVEGLFKKNRLNSLINSIKSIPNVLTAFEIKPESLKNLSVFLSELELHFMKIRKETKHKLTFTKK